MIAHNVFQRKATTTKLSIAFALTVALTASAFIFGCTGAANTSANDSSGNLNVTDKTVNVAASTTKGTASVLDKECLLKGSFIGAQHIHKGSNDVFMASFMIEPNVSSGIDLAAKSSKWDTVVYFIARGDNGDYLGSWASDPITYDWTFGDRIDDTADHAACGKAPNFDFDGVSSVEAYVISAKGTFDDGSVAEWSIASNLTMEKNNQGDAQIVEKYGADLGSQKVRSM